MDDLEFVRRCVTGDKQAWDEFIAKYSRLIYNYIYNVLNTGSKDISPDQINDIFQEIFCSLAKDNFKKLSSFKGRNGCSLASWLRRVTINLSIDYLRKVRPALSLDEEVGDASSLKEILADDSPDAADMLSHKERANSLKECIEQLSTDDKFLLELHLNQGLKLEKIREIFNISRSAIDMRKSRLIENLRDCFKGKGFMLDF